MRRVAMLMIMLASVVSVGSRASVIAYPRAACYTSSPLFSVTASGRSVPVIHFTDYHYVHLSFDGAMRVKVTANENIDTFDISPHSLKIGGKKDGRTLSFDVRSSHTPCYLVIQINSLEKLAILADPPEKGVPLRAGAGILNVRESPYCADATAKTDVTAVLQRAIDDAGSAGGGVVYVPAGVYKVTRTLMMTCDNVRLYLEGGAVIKASENRSDYAATDHTKPVIQAKRASHVTIEGRGVVDASGFPLFDKVLDEATHVYPGRRAAIRFDDCTDCTVEGIVIRDGTSWTLAAYTCDRVLIRNAKVINFKNADEYKIQNDGIDICSTRHARVDKCFVMTVDDTLCSKAMDENRPMYDVIFTDNVLFTSCAGHKSGMQARSEMHDIWFADNDIIQCRRGLVVEATTGSALMHDLHYLDTRVEHQVPMGEWAPKNMDFVAETASFSDVEMSRIRFEELHKNQFAVRRPNVIADVRLNELRAGGTHVDSVALFRKTLDGELKDVRFDTRSTPICVHFEDVRDHWAREDIEGLALRGFIRGDGARFMPDKAITARDFGLLLSRTLGLKRLHADAGSHALTRDEMVVLATEAAKSAGLPAESAVVENGGASPATVTRAEAAVIVARMFRSLLEHRGRVEGTDG